MKMLIKKQGIRRFDLHYSVLHLLMRIEEFDDVVSHMQMVWKIHCLFKVGIREKAIITHVIYSSIKSQMKKYQQKKGCDSRTEA